MNYFIDHRVSLLPLGCYTIPIATICVGEIMSIIFLNWDKVGGAVGIWLPTMGTSFVNFQFNNT